MNVALLRRNDPAQRVSPRQHDAAMVDLRRRLCFLRQLCPFHQGPSAGGAPVSLRILRNHGMALTANPFHTESLTYMRRLLRLLTRGR